MKQKNNGVIDGDMNPQKSLEQILQLEIEIAERISEARQNADKKIAVAQHTTTDVKEQNTNLARQERDRLIQEGIEKSRQTTLEKISSAKQDAQKFFESGMTFEEEASHYVLDLLLGNQTAETK